MSSFIVDKVHIDLLVRAGLLGHYGNLSWYHNNQRHELDHSNANKVGQMLLTANIKGVCDRYEDTHQLTNLPGPANAYWLIPYKYEHGFLKATPVEIIKSIRCYEYQACDADDYNESEAHAFCDALLYATIQRLPGYEQAPWGWTETNEKRELLGRRK